MSHQCRNCGRDVNNNYTPYTNAYATAPGSQPANEKSVPTSGKTTGGPTTQITAKVMFGTVGAIKELREKEQAEKNSAARAGRRQ